MTDFRFKQLDDANALMVSFPMSHSADADGSTLHDIHARLEWMRHQQRLLEAVLHMSDALHCCTFPLRNNMSASVIPTIVSGANWNYFPERENLPSEPQNEFEGWTIYAGGRNASTDHHACKIAEPSGFLWESAAASVEPAATSNEETDPLPLINIARAFLGRTRQHYAALVLIDGGAGSIEPVRDDASVDEDSSCVALARLFLSHRRASKSE